MYIYYVRLKCVCVHLAVLLSRDHHLFVVVSNVI